MVLLIRAAAAVALLETVLHHVPPFKAVTAVLVWSS
jgi:hypothetical protein